MYICNLDFNRISSSVLSLSLNNFIFLQCHPVHHFFPLGLTRSSVVQSSFNTSIYYMNVTWTPISSQSVRV